MLERTEHGDRIHIANDANPAAPTLKLDRKVWQQLERGIRNGDYDLVDPASGEPGQPPQLWYGEGANDYIAVTFETGTVLIRDGNDTTGMAVQVSHDDWREFVAGMRGDDKDTDRTRGTVDKTGRADRDGALREAERTGTPEGDASTVLGVGTNVDNAESKKKAK